MENYEQENNSDVVFELGIRRLRGRRDCISLTLPQVWIKQHELDVVGKCFVRIHTDSNKRLVIVPVQDMRDDAPRRKSRIEYEPNY